ncbi:putative F-box protein At5g66830 [Lotus japonicus]|uniref:putative F-box protein At5g66830 n=1 Tax=Lotus japonicus TaxID=34305 RepID=UPI00258B813C|nr:putative F-box protein At5g66830 [Lotus japonicus]
MENHMEEVALQLRDWSKMPTEILEQVCKRLTIPDQAAFIAVCKTWLSANTSKKASHWIPDAPWIVSNNYTSAQFQAISTTNNQAYNIYKPFNPLRNTYILGSSKGWLILKSDQNLFILNLFSKLRLDLPPLRTTPCSGGDCFGIHKPIVFTIDTCPNMNPTSVAVVTYKGDLGWCKVGDTTWKGYHTNDEFYSNVAFYDNKLYAVERDGLKVNIFKYDQGVLIKIGSVESTNPNEHIPDLSIPMCFINMSVYLVECGGKVFVVKRFSDNTKRNTPTRNFTIFAVEENCTTPQLVKVESLDDHILFVAGLNIECLDAKYCPKFQRDNVYFICYYEKSHRAEVKMFSVADRTIHKTLLNSTNMPTPSPIWMIPRFPFECVCEVCTSAPWFRPRELKKRLMLRKTNVA